MATAAPTGRVDAAGADPDVRRRTVDETMWCPWLRDLILERYRLAVLDDALPLPGGQRCAWSTRVALGRVVEESLAGVYGRAATSHLLADALEVAGFGQAPARPGATGNDRASMRRWTPPPPGDADLRAGLLGTIADALLAVVAPAEAADDGSPAHPASGPAPRRTVDVDDTDIDALVRDATRHAVLAYAGHVERLAERSLHTTRGLRAVHERRGPRPVLVR